MILAIDAGNTRTKWGVFDAQGALQSHGAWLNAELMQYENLMAPVPAEWLTCTQTLISNVAGTRLANVIKAKLAPLNSNQHWVVPTKQAANLLNHYEYPEKLGSDRWLALIAVAHEYAVPSVVINAGTALTVDALNIDQAKQGIFLGGLILPGLSLMQNSLLENAANITALDAHANAADGLPLNTGDAVYFGALSAMAGAVKYVSDKLKQYASATPMFVVSGGDGQLLIEYLRSESLVEPEQLILAENLVLKGLYFLQNSLNESPSV